MAPNRLVGREDELARLLRELEGLDTGTPPVMTIVGEAGIGKSRLIAELAARADEAGCLVFAGRAAEFEQELPFGVFVDALDPYLGTLNPGRMRALGTESRSELAAVFPGLADLAGAGAGTSPARALPGPPRGALAAGAARPRAKLRAASGRHALGGPGLAGAGRAPAAAPAPSARADRHRLPPSAGAASPAGGPRAGRARGCRGADRAAAAECRAGGAAPGRPRSPQPHPNL